MPCCQYRGSHSEYDPYNGNPNTSRGRPGYVHFFDTGNNNGVMGRYLTVRQQNTTQHEQSLRLQLYCANIISCICLYVWAGS